MTNIKNCDGIYQIISKKHPDICVGNDIVNISFVSNELTTEQWDFTKKPEVICFKYIYDKVQKEYIKEQTGVKYAE
jgi:hypothetical protein